ncbi:DinB family protein [Flagellimonas halotolerans]|uniref:DinB family protein n=1 Tax=Flagellimonas halotolerans TaxID=3112164 RepID=A0ABU6ILB4_9FLAO|nr:MULTISPECIES: DinB family protein [unclassified Allomuricauda]MEC3964023.1 DinB family protein [Muricauda sp. SYSU M86414]MEC4263893.1 DinB family protein [Muricauda sp. SYSU M84420]
MSSTQEYWLSGPIPEVPALLQPAAHALLQSVREVKEYLSGFPENKLWEKPFGRASVGFHLKHLTGVLDRLLTYAKEETLTDAQFQYLKNEGNGENAPTSQQLIADFETKVGQALDCFKTIPETTLTNERFVGRKKLPTTVIGLLFHAAEHSQRHVGQLLVTVSVLKG